MVSILTNINFSDVETGYKIIKTKEFKGLRLQENSFAIEIEITMKLAKKNSSFMKLAQAIMEELLKKVKKLKWLMDL